MRTIWVMCATSESGDDYDCAESWDHEPSQQEIDVVRSRLDATEYDEEVDGEWEEGSETCITVDGKRYVTYILNWTISTIKV